MFKKEVTYSGFDGLETKTLYFNLTKVELNDLVKDIRGKVGIDILEANGEQLSTQLQLLDVENTLEFITLFVRHSHGVRDGNKFVKNDVTREEFKGSMEEDAFLTFVLESPDNLVSFINAITPK